MRYLTAKACITKYGSNRSLARTTIRRIVDVLGWFDVFLVWVSSLAMATRWPQTFG